MENPVIVSAVRTAVGKFGGTLSSLSACRLGTVVIKEAIARSGIAMDDIDEVVMGNVVSAGLGQAPARQAARGAGVPDKVPAMTLNKVCGSGLKSVVLAAQAVKCGDAEVVVAGGMESMSNIPYIMTTARNGFRMGHQKVIDAMIHDGLWDPYNDVHMGITGEIVAEKYEISREAQDEWAYNSHQKAVAAIESGAFKREIVPVEVPRRKKDPILFDTDEMPRKETTIESLAKLRPAFKKDGTVTAGNASGINDGAAALVVTSASRAAELGVKPRAEIVAYASSGLAPEMVMMAPEPAVRMVWEKTGWSAEEVDYYEINEAFSVQQVALGRELGIDPAKHNARGGGVSIGHPIGASGARILTTLIHLLEDEGKEKGIATLCLGGGNAVAMGIKILK